MRFSSKSVDVTSGSLAATQLPSLGARKPFPYKVDDFSEDGTCIIATEAGLAFCTVKTCSEDVGISTCIALFLADLRVSACAGQLLHCQVASQTSLYVRRNAVTSAIQLHCTDPLDS